MRIDAKKLEAFVAAIFRAAGCSEAESRRVGLYLVRANLTGHDSHGVVRVPRYLGWLRDGDLVPDREPEVVARSEAFAVLDGHYGFGQTAGPAAVRLGVEIATLNGVAVIALRRAGHLGRIGEWAEQAVEAGLVSVHFVNVSGSALVAPFGGAERRFSTAPFAAGFPAPNGEPVVLDFATSAVAEGKVLVASHGGNPLPARASSSLTDGSALTRARSTARLRRDRPATPGTALARSGRSASIKGRASPSCANSWPAPSRARDAAVRAHGGSATACCRSIWLPPSSHPQTPSRPRRAPIWSSSRAPGRLPWAARCCSPASRNGAPERKGSPRVFRSPRRSGHPSAPLGLSMAWTGVRSLRQQRPEKHEIPNEFGQRNGRWAEHPLLAAHVRAIPWAMVTPRYSGIEAAVPCSSKVLWLQCSCARDCARPLFTILTFTAIILRFAGERV